MGLLLVFLAFTIVATARAQGPDWKNAFRTDYFKSSEESFAIHGDEIYAFGCGARSLAAATNRYYFVRYGGMSGGFVLSESNPEDARVMQSLQIVNPGDPRHAQLQENYKNVCWSRQVWKNGSKQWLDEGKKLFKK